MQIGDQTHSSSKDGRRISILAVRVFPYQGLHCVMEFDIVIDIVMLEFGLALMGFTCHWHCRVHIELMELTCVDIVDCRVHMSLALRTRGL